MQTLVNTNHSINGSASLNERVETIVANSVDRFADRITRVEVHLSDANGDKHGARDKCCAIEARLGGLSPVFVSHEAPTLLEAIETAADKLERALEHTLGRLENAAGRGPRDAEVAGGELLDDLERGSNSRKR